MKTLTSTSNKMIEQMIEKRLRYYSGLRDQAVQLLDGNIESALKTLWQIEDRRSGPVLFESFIEQARDKLFFKEIYNELDGEVNKRNLMNLKSYRIEEPDSSSIINVLQSAMSAIDSRLAGIIEPMKSMPYFYTSGKLAMNCQALAQLSTILYSFENDISDLRFGESVYSDRRDYFLKLLGLYSDLNDDSFYIVNGSQATSRDDLRYSLERLFKEKPIQEESHFDSAGYGDQIKDQLLNMAISMEEPHGIIVNSVTGEEYDAYDGENRRYTEVPITEGLHAISMLDIMFLKHFVGKDRNNYRDYQTLREEFKHDSPTLSAAGAHFTDDWDTKNQHLSEARELYMKHGGIVPAKHVVLELTHLMDNLWSQEAREGFLERTSYLQREYFLDDALEKLGQRFAIPELADIDKTLRRK